jgi:hypothetical protein
MRQHCSLLSEGLDVDVEMLAGRVRDFSSALKGASVGAVLLRGSRPAGSLANEGDVAYETVELSDVLKHMERQAKTNVSKYGL